MNDDSVQPNIGTTKTATGTPPSSDDVQRSSARWRSVWRIHFYSGMFAMPFLLLMAITGLVILYTQPIEDLSQADIRLVDRGDQMMSFDTQAAAVATAYPDAVLGDLTPPAASNRATRFFVDDGSGAGLHVFVDPYRGEVLGDSKPGGGIVGLANRLHGFLNNESIMVPLPTVSAFWDDGAVMRDYVLGDIILEILGIWTLVLVSTGLFIWWPRSSRWSNGTKGGRKYFGMRRDTSGRARWRDLHGLGGVMVLGVMILTLVSGMAWSSYWGANFASFTNEVTPGEPVDQPTSTPAVRGDLDRFGNQIPWNTGDRPIPASYMPTSDGTSPTPLSLDEVVRIAEEEGMKPGYTISFPVNDVDEAANPVFGSFTLYNSWPRKTSEARDLFVDQFTGETLAEQNVYGYGALSVGMDTLVSTHMGTQLGIFSRILMTMLCVLTIWSVISALVMFKKRRRPGTAGLPRRPSQVGLAGGVIAVGAVIAVVYPLWGLTAFIVAGLDRFVVRRVPVLRRTFGQA